VKPRLRKRRTRKQKTAVCDTCGENFHPFKVAGEEEDTTCVRCRHLKLELPDDRFVEFLKRAVVRLREGLELQYFDCTEIGAKETHCSWGTCSHDVEAWPDAEDHLWPDQFVGPGYQRVAPKYHKLRHFCPFDRRVGSRFSGKPKIASFPDGCFYRCMIFNPKGSRPTREEAILLYEAQIVRACKGG